MRQSLKLHPDCRCYAVASIDVDAARTSDNALALKYVVTGDIGGLLIPPRVASGRTSGLWRHTCFEAFVRLTTGAYYELNFSPSKEWAAFKFTDYRNGMADEEAIGPPKSEVDRTPARLELRVSVWLGKLHELVDLDTWQIGLSAVIEERSGRMSYWALAHPQGKPDFHHADCFQLELARPSSP